MKMRRLYSCIMALLMLVSMPLTAFAETYDVAEGSVTVNASESGQTVTHGSKDAVPDSTPIITGTTDKNTVTIKADAGSTANVTLKDVNIDTSGTNQAAVEIKGGGNVTIELDGTNTVQGGDYHAGVEKNDGDSSGSLIITDENGTDGSLKATGGEGGAGIGGGYESSASDITISGGTVNAIGGEAPSSGDELVPGGGAGIGGGVYGTGDNIAVEKDAIVTATGDGRAADIGDGYKHSTQKQSSEVNVSGLYTTGSVTIAGVTTHGTVRPPKKPSGGSGTPKTVASYKTWSDVGADLGGLKVSDNDGNELSNVVWLKEEGELEITGKEDKVSVIGNKADLLQLTVEGVNKINLKTNRVNVSVSNEVLNKITGTGGSFQLSTDDTTVNLTATDQNNKKTLDMTLTANKQSGTQAAPDQNSKKPEISIDAQPNTGNNSEGGTLQVSTNAPEATLSLDQKYLQTLQNSEFSKLALAVGNLITTVDSMLAANTAVNGSGSISIGNETVNMNGFKFSAGDSSENDQLTDMVNNIKFKKEITPVGGSTMVVEVDAKAPLKSASLKVPGSALQSLMDQGVEETALSINGKTTSIKNSNLRTQLGDSQPGSTAVINVKHLANDEITIFAD